MKRLTIILWMVGDSDFEVKDYIENRLWEIKRLLGLHFLNIIYVLSIQINQFIYIFYKKIIY